MSVAAIPIPSSPRHLACAETWSGNERTASAVEMPGLTAWVHSVPAEPGDRGGDVNYMSVCPGCVVSRIALADVSGHGQTVAAFGDKLRELMQRYLRDLEQIPLMSDLNQAVREELGDGGHYATMVAIGWHGDRGLMVMTNAGHPPPLFYRASRNQWSWLVTRQPAKRDGRTGLPLGLFPHVTYDRLVVKPQSRDLVVLYSDGVSEAASPAGNELGLSGLMNMARALAPDSAETVGRQLASALAAFRGEHRPLDDETIIVMRRNDATAIGAAAGA